MNEDQKNQIIQKRYLPALRKAKISPLAMNEIKEIYQDIISKGLSKETAEMLFYSAFSIFSNEVCNG